MSVVKEVSPPLVQLPNSKSAHKLGMVWAEVKIKGGSIGFGGKPIGTLSMKGPLAVGQSFLLWRIAMGDKPSEAFEALKRLSGVKRFPAPKKRAKSKANKKTAPKK